MHDDRLERFLPEHTKYMRLKLSDIPEEIIKQYKLREITTPDGYVYMEIMKGMYGLPQAGIIAQVLLEEHLDKFGYSQSTIIPGLWIHATRPILFSLVVDDFPVKYTRREISISRLVTSRPNSLQ